MIAWRGAGFLVFCFSAAAFLGVVLGFDGPAKETFLPWGIAALGSGMLTLPLGIWLNRGRKDATHDFMFIPMQYWGGLLLVAGVGMLATHGVMAGIDTADEAGGDPCAELSNTMSACGPAASMIVSHCQQSSGDTPSACLACVQASPDPCNPSACESACGF